MKTKIKRKWVAALRSGEFTQGFGRLFDGRCGCSLFVLCELHRRETGAGSWQMERIKDPVTLAKAVAAGMDADQLHYLGQWQCLPVEVQKWAGLTRYDPLLQAKTVTELNDVDKKTFAQMADAIEAGL